MTRKDNPYGCDPFGHNAVRYTVIIKDGEVVDRDLRPVSPSLRATCGHEHKTEAVAEQCLRDLRHRHCDRCGSRTGRGQCRVGGGGHSMVESARWYNAEIHAHRPGDMAYLTD